MLVDTKGQVAIVTGAAKGIGAAVVKRMVKSGVKPVLVDIDSCDELISELKHEKGNYLQFQGDIREESFVKNTVNETINEFGKIDILVNNAGVGSRVSLQETTEEIWNFDMDVNMKATFFFTKAVIESSMLNEKYGRIINISSVSGMNGGVVSNLKGSTGGRSGPAYAASKGAIIAFTKWIAKEFGENGITCNSVAPGATATNLTTDVDYDYTQQAIKRMGTPDDIANAVFYFASPVASYVTGEIFKVDGGAYFG